MSLSVLIKKQWKDVVKKRNKMSSFKLVKLQSYGIRKKKIK